MARAPTATARPPAPSTDGHDVDAAPWPVAAELRLHEPAAIDIVWHPTRRLHLAPFLGRACGLADAAALLGIKKTAMSYWIQRLLDAGLIRPWTPLRRRGRLLPRYRAVADRFRLALTEAPHESYEAVFEDSSARWRPHTLRALARSLARQAPWLELTIHANAASGLGSALEPVGSGAPPDDYLYYWGRLWLDADERDALRRELDALWDRYAALSDRQRKPAATLVHLLTVPDRGD